MPEKKNQYIDVHCHILPEVDDQSAIQHWNIMVAILANEPERAEQARARHAQKRSAKKPKKNLPSTRRLLYNSNVSK